jgi:hypothetical protein
MSAPAAQQNNSPQAITPVQFLKASKPKTVRIASGLPYVDGLTQSFPMPQSGLLETIWINIAGTVTVTGTVTSGTFQSYPNPAPFSIIRRIRFGSNNSFNLRDISGWSWYKWIRYRTGIDYLTNQSGIKFSANTLTVIGTNLSNSIVNGANVVAQTYNVGIAMPMPIAYNHMAQAGLIVLAINAVIYSVQIDWGRITGGIGATGGTNDLFNTLVGTGLTVTASISTFMGIDWFEPPRNVNLNQLINMFMQVTDQTFTPLTSNDNVFQPPPNDFYTLLLFELVNNGAAITLANLQAIQWQYAGSVYDYLDDSQIKAVKSSFQHDIPGMDGVIDFDFGLRGGVFAQRDVFDAFNNMSVTDLKVHVTIPSSVAITGLNQCSAVFESLRLVRQLGA